MATTQAFRNALHIPWADPLVSQVVSTTTAGDFYQTGWITPGGIDDAPADGQQYAREDESWTVVVPPVVLPIDPSDVTGLEDDLDGRVMVAGDTMTGPLALPVGSATSTSLNFGTAGTGFYGAAQVVAVAILGANKLSFTPTQAGLAVPLVLPNTGSAAATVLNWGVPGTGIWSTGTSAILAAISGVTKLQLTAAALSLAVPVSLPGNPVAGLDAAPKQYVDAGDSALAAGKEPVIAPGTTAQYWRGDKTWVNFPAGDAVAYIGDGPPSSPAVGKLWWESDTGNMFIWYDDGNTIQWVPANAPVLPEGGWVELTAAEYAALSPPDPDTLYIVVG